MRRTFKKKRKNGTDPVEIQITSLADILIVVLVFLLKSVSTELEDMETITVPTGVNLPTVTQAGIARDGLKIEVTATSVAVAGNIAARLRRHRFHPDDLNRDLAQGGTSKSLQKAISQVAGSKKYRGKSVWIIADNRAPYATIQTVLASTAIYGFNDFKLAVVKAE